MEIIMSRGRPPKYKTDEERKAAYAAKAREKYRQAKGGVRPYSKNSISDIEKYRGTQPYKMYHNTRTRAKAKGWDHNLDIEFISDLLNNSIVCPIFGTVYSNSNLKSIDRIDSAKGYTKDNVHIISRRANTIKNDATLEELEKLTAYLKSLVKK